MYSEFVEIHLKADRTKTDSVSKTESVSPLLPILYAKQPDDLLDKTPITRQLSFTGCNFSI